MTRSPIIVALDVESAADARTLVKALGDSAGFYKVGMELYASAGMDFVRELLGQGKQVFLDLKLYDIGETVRRAVAQVARAGANMLTVHAVGQVMRAAVEGKGDSQLKLLAVTVLTSFDQSDVTELGYSCTTSELVAMRVRTAVASRVDGIVCSPLDVRAVREIVGPSVTLVTPGVRSAGASKGDQKRVATPAEALAAGANYLVIGRQVTRAADPAAALAHVHAEL
jgi:orotidine-5'-phosphate decarboxylase